MTEGQSQTLVYCGRAMALGQAGDPSPQMVDQEPRTDGQAVYMSAGYPDHLELGCEASPPPPGGVAAKKTTGTSSGAGRYRAITIE